MAQSPISVTELDHIVLVCDDVETTMEWYVDKLALEPLRVDEWRAGSVPFPSLRVAAETIIDLFPASSSEADNGRLDHYCLTIDPIDLDAVAASGMFDVVSGPATRWGARGDGRSLYVRDPEGVSVELRHY